jgi:hypothetical protein
MFPLANNTPSWEEKEKVITHLENISLEAVTIE